MILSSLALLLAVIQDGQAGFRAPPELPVPAFVDYNLSAHCFTTSLNLGWRAKPAESRITSFRFGPQVATAAQLAEWNGWLQPLRGDVFARVSCNGDAAVIDIVENVGAKPRVVRVEWQKGQLRLVRGFAAGQ